MSNRAYLTVCDGDEIYPWSGETGFDPAAHVALACDGCVPLLWMGLFSADDLRTQTFRIRDHVLEATAPAAPRAEAVARLRARARTLSGWFANNGGVDAHVALLASHLDALPGRFVSIELEEIEALHAQFDLVDVMRTALSRLDDGDESCLDLLLPLSTVLEDRPFLLPTQAAASDAREDRWNVFRLIGGGWILPTPWDDADPDAAVRRQLNAARRRDPFATRLPG